MESKFLESFDELALNLHGVRRPSFHVSTEDKRKLGVSEDISNRDFLEALCQSGREKMWSSVRKEHKSEYARRIDYELKTVEELGFVDYL